MFSHLHDTHFHLDLFNKELTTVADSIEQRKIYTIAVTNLPPLYNALVHKLGDSYKYIRPALGFHPELIGQYKELIPQMWELLPKAKYIGEVGLDFKTGNDFRTEQVQFFENLIERCNHLGGKVLTIHSRRSAEDIVSVIGNSFNGKYILHWYSGNKKILKRALVNGAFFSINYAMTNSSSGENIIKEIPLERLLLESDGPFIKYEGQTFTPVYNKYILKNLSRILNYSENEISDILFNNFKSLIGNNSNHKFI